MEVNRNGGREEEKEEGRRERYIRKGWRKRGRKESTMYRRGKKKEEY